MRSHSPSSPSDSDDDRSQQATTNETLVVDWDLSPVDETTLVTVRVTNTLGHAQEIRIDNRLDGPVSPPRRRGVPTAGWDDTGVSRSVGAKETVSVGYACRAPPKTPPVRVSNGADVPDQTPVKRALQSLGEHAPPRAVLPRENAASDDDGADEDTTTDCEAATESHDGAQQGVMDERDKPADAIPSADDAPDSPVSPSTSASTSTPPSDSSPVSPAQTTSDGVPHTVTAWFDAVDARLDTAERLSGDVREATPVIASLGGCAGLETLAATMESDELALRRVADRATALADRLDETAVPQVGSEQ